VKIDDDVASSVLVPDGSPGAIDDTASYGGCVGDTLSPGETLEVTFTAVPNSADMLFFFSNVPLTNTGSPVITTELLDGTPLLGTFTEFTDRGFFQAVFESPSGVYTASTPSSPAPTRVDFTDINNGTINGRLTVSVTGGTINYDANDLILYDAKSLSAADISSLGDLTKTSTIVVTPEPGVASLLGIGLVGLMFLSVRKYAR
jgi:hypothetical protein